jgi:hypothetical protein
VARGSIPILRVGRNLLVTVQTELHDAVAEAFQEDLLGSRRTGDQPAEAHEYVNHGCPSCPPGGARMIKNRTGEEPTT